MKHIGNIVCIMFVSSMEDEKYDRAFGGLQTSGSSYICTLCTADMDAAKRNCGTFVINRTLHEITTLGEYVRANPDKLSDVAMSSVAKGVKDLPLLRTEPMERMLDATHADINMATFFKKLIVRIIAGVTKWEATKDVKPKLENAEVFFDNHINKYIGSNPQLMMTGNYARMLFAQENVGIVTQLIADDDDRKNITDILGKFREMRVVYRSNVPDHFTVAGYKTLAVSFAMSLKEHFPFARWTNYLHKLVEHVQELIEWKEGPGSIGAMSSEGNEAGNKVFRHFRKNLSCKGNTYQGIVDVLRLHWLYSSPKLVRLAHVSHNKIKCGICGNTGHNRVTCVQNIISW
jgi:V(D)J recombination-activating protein 1